MIRTRRADVRERAGQQSQPTASGSFCEAQQLGEAPERLLLKSMSVLHRTRVGTTAKQSAALSSSPYILCQTALTAAMPFAQKRQNEMCVP